MATLLRQIVAGPRARHPEAGLDLCYVTDNIIATSGPSGTYPQLAYRNPLKQLVKFLDDKHGDQWAIWEFRAEGTGYPDDEVYNRVNHYPWPDHHPPPFALIPLIMASMRNWLKEEATPKSSLKSNGVHNTTAQPPQELASVPEPPQPLHTEQRKSTDALVIEPDTSGSSDSPANTSLDLPSDSTDRSSLDTSDGSPTESVRKRKNVRWRESTILPPKEDREKLTPASDSHPSKKKNSDSKPPISKPTKSKRVVVVHCKAGKGRSGTISCSYLISQEGWTVSQALSRFTERRMRPGFGAGVSIPSQLRWISYVDRWTRHGKRYTERPVEILEVHVWGLRDRVKVSIEGFKDEGRKIETLHNFTTEERDVPDGDKSGGGFAALVGEVVAQEHKRRQKTHNPTSAASASAISNGEAIKQAIEEEANHPVPNSDEGGKGDVVFRPAKRIIADTSDVNVDFERRNKGLSGMNMITSVAHVWFNAFFEGDGPEREGDAKTDGVFTIEWDKMDGIKGSSRKGTRAFDKLAVVWRVVDQGQEVSEPKVGEEVRQGQKAEQEGEGEQERKREERDVGEEVQSSTESLSKGEVNA